MDDNTPFDYNASGCSREAFDVRFMYFSPEELRNISVAKVESAISFDELKMAMDGGLHDKALGPLDIRDRSMRPLPCATCGLEKDCPGHVGHIEMACPVYNPFLMPTVYKLLQQSCASCCRLRADPARTKELIRVLSEMMPGTLVGRGVHTIGAKKRSAFLSECVADEKPSKLIMETCKPPKEEGGEPEYKVKATTMPARTMIEHADYAAKLAEECAAASAEQQASSEAANAKAGAPRRGTDKLMESAQIESMREVLKQYLSELTATCPFCKQRAAKWRKEGHSQLYMKRPGDQEDMLCLPVYVRDLLRSLWENDGPILRWLIPGSRESGADIFFIEALAVPPTRFRMPDMSGGEPRLALQSGHLRNILLANEEVKKVVKARKDAQDAQHAQEAAVEAGGDAAMPSVVDEANEAEQEMALKNAVAELQIAVNSFMDSSKSEKHKRMAKDGIRQLLERKEGLFRMKMMGKRVNFAARSVISPDPNIETSEIGIPMMIAENLYYPEVAASHNAKELRELVMRGRKYPGAAEVHIPDARGGKTVVNLGPNLNPEKREAIAKQLITDIESGKPPMTVFRQLRDGDPLLVNRQPTLHKPGIMAHTAKVLRCEKTIRLHYVNCNTYNADFDGDEMNLHAPQDPIGRMEALGIARADRQYLVPTSGRPLRGLIQDHVIAGTMLTKRDTFYGRGEVSMLLYQGLRAALDHIELPLDRGARPGMDDADVRSFPQRRRLHLDPPTIWRPRPVWTGKQVFSMLLKNLMMICDQGRTPGLDFRKDGLFLDSKSKTPGEIWNGRMDGNKEEAIVRFMDSELLQGVLDKSQFGASMMGIAHVLFELMGGHIVSVLLASIARLFTLLLQQRGFTCAFRDLLLTDQTEVKRSALVKDSRYAGKKSAEAWLEKQHRPEFKDGTYDVQMLSEAAQDLLLSSEAEQQFEGMMIGSMKQNWSNMINQCIPVGQKLPFPKNCFAAMVQTGAKGSSVNHSQISCCLGQQELEGRLPPLMATRRALPCFAPYDLASRTRGYISDRFLTGIRPQEFFYHCMAGREGLVDTAVKTSRSGYLQRCLVKHLETLKVGYDLTVRDSDGAVVQFLYGEDGVDVTRATYLFKYAELYANFKLLRGSSLQQMAQLRANRRVVDFDAAGKYMEAQKACGEGKVGKAGKLLKAMIAAAERKSFRISGCGLAEFDGEYKAGPEDDADKALSYAHVDRPHLTCECIKGQWFLSRGDEGKAVRCYRHPKDAKKLPADGWEVFKGGREPAPTIELVELDNNALNTLKVAAEKLVGIKKHQGAGLDVVAELGQVMTDPAASVLTPSHYFGATSELHESKLQDFIAKERKAGTMSDKDAQDFADFMHLKYMRALAEPGEAVGVIAAQSMGEPSTQMTLNTFHLAGHGGANVTLGIPRLREIVQTGSKSCSTPLMRINIIKDRSGGDSMDQRMTCADRERTKFRRVTLLDCLARLAVNESIQYVPSARGVVFTYHCRFEFLPILEIEKRVSHVSKERIEAFMKGVVSRKLKSTLVRIIRMTKAAEAGATASKKTKEEGEETGGAKVTAEDNDADAQAEGRRPKKRMKKTLGAEDKAIKEEEEDEAEEQDEDGSENEIESGMYDSEEEGPQDDEEDEDLDEEKAEAKKRKMKKEKKDEDEEDAEVKAEPDEDDEEEAAAGPKAKRAKKEEDAKGKKEDAKEATPKAGKKEAKTPKKAAPVRALTGKQLLTAAIGSGELVYTTAMVNDVMTIVVHHRYSDCPHSLFVGDVLQGICRESELQDPACEGVKAVHVKEEEGVVSLECEGINLFGLQVLNPEIVDHRTIYTNNVLKILEHYGVEAARAAIVREVQSVFGPYGIAVDSRHLALIADYMTQAGGVRAFNRMGMLHNASPLLQMSFETTMQFLTAACQDGLSDSMKSPASALVMGQLPSVGTGMVSLLVDLKPAVPSWKQKRQFFKSDVGVFK